MAKKKKQTITDPAPIAAPVKVTFKPKYQNSIKRPESNSNAAFVWDFADQLSATLGDWATEQDVVDSIGEGNPVQIKRQAARWKLFHKNETFPTPTKTVVEEETK